MPTPSSHDEPQAVSLNSTCPDEQIIPRSPEDRSQPSTPLYEDINESPTETSIADQTAAEDNASTGTLQGDQAHYATDGPPSPYAQSSPAMSPSTPHDVDHNDMADKQAESDTDVQDLVSTYGSPSGSRGTRPSVGDMSDRRANARGPIVRSVLRVDGRDMARYSIPETDIWQPHVLGRAPTSQLSSRSSTHVDTPASTAPNETWEDYEVDDDYAYPEDSPLFMPCDPTSLRVWHLTRYFGYCERQLTFVFSSLSTGYPLMPFKIPSSWQPVRGQPAVGEAGVRRPGRDQAC